MRWLAVCVLLAACGGDSPQQIDRPDGGIANETPGNGDVPVVLPAHCPCPLGSYCDLATDRCQLGCIGNDQCPSGQRCDTTVFQCAHVCANDADCTNHIGCVALAGGSKICKGCASGWANCNNLPADGCEAPLNTINDCGACGKRATTMCYRDHDGDGYVDRSVPAVLRCSCEGGERADVKGDDCDDADWAAHPGQTSFFSRPRASGGFDFDCDGLITRDPELTVDGTCTWPCHGVFWADMQPACGVMGTVIDCYQWDTDTCSSRKNRTLLQTCR